MFGEINERQHEYLRDIWSSGKHLLQLLSDILDLSKVEAGHMDLESVIFSVRDALEYGISMMRERATSHGLSLILDVDPSVAFVETDELRFKQVVINLLSNAVKFTPDGGEVTVTATVDGDDVVITVTDTGVGIARKDRERIFESFEQGGRSASTHEGTGLGLTLCRRIVGLMGGRMWLESEVGVGSTFAFSVPVGRQSAPGRDEPRPDRARMPTILVIEDDRHSVDLLTAYLESAGFDVSSAQDGTTGLAAMQREKPVAVILDVRLPRMDGWDVLQAIRMDPETSAVPVVVVSVLDERAKGLALGAAEYLVKPVSREDLMAALSRVRVVPPAGAAGSRPRSEYR